MKSLSDDQLLYMWKLIDQLMTQILTYEECKNMIKMFTRI